MTHRIIIINQPSASRHRSRIFSALNVLRARGEISSLIEVKSIDEIPDPMLRFSFVFTIGAVPFATTQALACSGVQYAMELGYGQLNEGIALRFSEETVRLATQLSNAGALIASSGAAADALLRYLDIQFSGPVLNLDSLVQKSSYPKRVPTELLFVGSTFSESASVPPQLDAAARKLGIKVRSVGCPRGMTVGEAEGFCSAFPNAAIRVLSRSSGSLAVAAAETIDGWNLCYGLLGSSGRDAAEVIATDLSTQPQGVLTSHNADRSHLADSDIADAIAEKILPVLSRGRAITGHELRLLGELAAARSYEGIVQSFGETPRFVNAPPQPPHPGPISPPKCDPKKSMSLAELAAPLPLPERGLLWRDALVVQAAEAESFLEDWGLLDQSLEQFSLARGSEQDLRIRMESLEGELRSAEALVESRLQAMREMERLIVERDNTIRWQERTLDERWNAMAEMEAHIQQLNSEIAALRATGRLNEDANEK